MFGRRKPTISRDAPPPGVPALQLDQVALRYHPKGADVLRGASLSIEPGHFVTVLGRSGVGKTTALRAVAGLESVTDGYIRIGGQLVASNFVNVPPERRGVGFVFQDYALFPNMTVEGNIQFAAHQLPPDQRKRAVEATMEAVGIARHRKRRPGQLSGGQQQRVAFGRALVARPALLLLDEPFSSVDGDTKQHLSDELLSVVRDHAITTVMVTHNREDALSISDAVAVMCDGRIKQYGAPEEVYRFPCSSDVANLCGPCSFVEGTYHDGRATTEAGVFRVKLAEGDEVRPGDKIALLIRPTDLTLRRSPTGGHARVAGHHFKGNTLEYAVALPSGATIKVAVLNSEQIPADTPIELVPRTTQPLMAFSGGGSAAGLGREG